MSVPSFSHPAGSLDSAVGRLTAAESAFTALGYAIRNGDLQSVKDILEGDEFNHQLLNKADYAGNTPVHLAAVSNRDVLKELLTRGASIHARNLADNTPLFLAKKTGNRGCIELLETTGGHLWEGERSRTASRRASRNSSPTRGIKRDNPFGDRDGMIDPTT